ncbi:hypothetical protein AALP_AA5G092500 [Arabis alpina]|uniref:non-specific serine/threonine protein kinase n=1 Tax=Arabis alpina TaxID=50452 RepID=A0A087GVX6_ARAAL|nr:hypothetical protein AALP_AA5G092500 [Arabis alpina]
MRQFLLLAFIVLKLHETYGFTVETDRQALLEFKSQVSEDGRVVLSSWNHSFPVCNWKGVTCGRKHKRVTGLALGRLQLGGVITPSIGGIPASLYNCSRLQTLELSENHLGGGVDSELGSLTKLVTLYLVGNKLRGKLPASLGNLTSLINVSFGDNNMEGEIPDEIGALPPTLSNISTLQILTTEDNSLTGNIPVSFGKVRNLRVLSFRGNSLGSHSAGDLEFLGALTNCTHLQKLNVGGNRLGGDLPTSIANLSTNLEYLSLSRNHISGSIPHDIGNLVNLQTLMLYENMLIGPLPVSLGKLSNLGLLVLNSNRMSGEIPFSIGNITHLGKLHLYENSFEGIIPPSLGNCRYLQLIDIAQNKMNGFIPQEIMQISPLYYLAIENNSFSGSLPKDVGQLQSLVSLSVAHNKLSGKLPQGLGKCLPLEELYLNGNSFDGEVPDIRRLVGLKEVDLSNNNLSGSIPAYLANFSSLEYLNLSINSFEGRVPTEGKFKSATIVSVYGNKYLCGGIKELKLKPCLAQAPALKKIVIGVSVGIALLLLLFIAFASLCWFRRRKKNQLMNNPAPSTLGAFHQTISYGDLRNATDGFSSSNFIGSGSFGTVFKALLPTENKVVAVKVLNLQRRGAMKSFLAECESLKDIRHRNLVKLLTACSSIDFQGNNFRALIYEFMPNGSLDMWLHQEEVEEIHRPSRTLTLLERLNISIDVASVLDYLHVRCHEPIAHCDLKPSNVLLDDDLTAHVSDFGLARLLLKFDQESFLNQLSSAGVRGTIGYAAPEYGMGGQPSIHGDVYSFGVLILEMFTGKRPTNELFGGNFTLHSFTKSALPGRVLDIADESILQNGLRVGFPIAECLTLVLDVGLRCCEESPTNRLATSKAMKELISIKERFFKTRRTTRR